MRTQYQVVHHLQPRTVIDKESVMKPNLLTGSEPSTDNSPYSSLSGTVSWAGWIELEFSIVQPAAKRIMVLC